MKISDAEVRVMEALWAAQPLGSGEVVEAVSAHEDWSPKTIRTLLDRLHRKGAVRREKAGRQYHYWPCLAREEWLRQQTGELIGKHCDGRLAPLVSAFASNESISEQDRREILALLEEMDS
ncbi:BlaI/MecI/CopY family transcriptional regulator [Gammaproteobacteria bacterium AB-CW1]|uniref:BlaI/MecI/CopY family transcriptional regulator n=1 Tax=Natronospira elongata TaxID=3110268 RepID=A0AAP6MMI4_9GAMM|nr:BlaI/MecI/CopY family transcriptional regulator [Gammaproteobacteria bacterium AB-CW1]